MDDNIKEKLEKAGWQVGSTQDFLKLSEEEMHLVEFRILLGKMLRDKRLAIGYTQSVLAKMIGSSQSRVAKMEVGDNSVSIDLILKSLFHIGISKKEICNYISNF
jgi:hypothetical protein